LPSEQLEAHADEIQADSQSEKAAASDFWSWRLCVPILLAILITFFNQLLGINAVRY
jgi:MFS transporter, SP family, arabinose:H+ symporter